MTGRDDIAGRAPIDIAQLRQVMGGFGHGQSIGLVYRDHGDDWAEFGLPYDARLIGQPATGILASGPIITLMDVATSTAIWVRRGELHPQATLDLRVDYLRPATPGKTVIGRGECYRLARQIAFVRGIAHDGDPADPIAHVAGTFMFTGNEG